MKKITILGLGGGDLAQLPLGVYRLLRESQNVYLRTKEHPVVKELEEEGFTYQSFDEVYERNPSFEEVYEEICAILLEKAKTAPVIYGVPGHPLVAERTVQLLLERGRVLGIDVEIAGGQSFLDPLFTALKIDPIEGFQLLDATSLKREEINITNHVIIAQVYDPFIASEVKLTLMEKLPDDYEIVVVKGAGSSGGEVKKLPLYELDRAVETDNLTSVYVPPVKDEKLRYREFSKLREIIAALRGPDGCPWDKKQTHASLKKYLLEEAYEVIEAINEEDIDHLIEELGDVLLQVMLHAQIGEDDGYFSIDDVIKVISEKMIRRHPHVFGNGDAKTADEVVQKWEEIKKAEKGDDAAAPVISDEGKHLPNLMRAYSIQKQAAKVGFDWGDVRGAWDKVKEELKEFEEEMERNGADGSLEKEFGDVLFALVNVARFYKFNPEEALFRTNQKFLRRFSHVEKKVQESGKPFADFTLDELDAFWNEAKKNGL